MPIRRRHSTSSQRSYNVACRRRNGVEKLSILKVESTSKRRRLFSDCISTSIQLSNSKPFQRHFDVDAHNIVTTSFAFILVYVIHGIHIVFIIITFSMPLITLSVSEILYISCTDGVIMSVHAAHITRIRDGNGSVGHGSDGSPFLDGSRGSCINASDSLVHDDEITA